MNIAGNFNKSTGLPIADQQGAAEEKATDELGIHWEGPVLSGKKSVKESLRDADIKAARKDPAA